MTESPQERWAAFVARGGPELDEVREAIAAAIARDGYLSAEQVMDVVGEALDRLEKRGDEGGFE